MNIFDRIVGGEFALESRLGNPLRDEAAIERRLNHFSTMTSGRGFRQPKKESRAHATFGTTRGERKRAARGAANAKEIERQKRECDRLVKCGTSLGDAVRGFGSL